jgi:hypothetical protein
MVCGGHILRIDFLQLVEVVEDSVELRSELFHLILGQLYLRKPGEVLYFFFRYVFIHGFSP